MAIIAINGYAGVGKDTVAQLIQELQPDKNWQIKKFSGKLKQMASLITGIPVEKFEEQGFKQNGQIDIRSIDWKNNYQQSAKGYEVRRFLQFLGTECVRDLLGKDVWVDALLKDYSPEKDNWIITDCRFPNELQGVLTLLGVSLRVERVGIKPINAHPSETALDDHLFDWLIENKGSLDFLKNEVANFLEFHHL